RHLRRHRRSCRSGPSHLSHEHPAHSWYPKESPHYPQWIAEAALDDKYQRVIYLRALTPLLTPICVTRGVAQNSREWGRWHANEPHRLTPKSSSHRSVTGKRPCSTERTKLSFRRGI